MPHIKYLQEQMGYATLSPEGPFEAGSYASITIVYTAGKFGVDDTGQIKICWRGTSDMATPQFTDPKAPHYTSVDASNGAVLEFRVDRINIRPWVNTLFIRVIRGFLREGETITIRFGDRRFGSPGLRLQSNVEKTFEFKVFVDAFATYEFTELTKSPEIALVPGPAARWKAILPTLAVANAPFRLALVAEDRWGNPTENVTLKALTLASDKPVCGLPDRIELAGRALPVVLNDLTVSEPGLLTLRLLDSDGNALCRANPLSVVGSTDFHHYWADLHGQSEETIGTNSAEEYFLYARDKAFVDIVGHQGNDFQITDAFWRHLNDLTHQFYEPGRFVALPGYEWSGNTGMGGDRNIFFLREGRPIRRSSSVLIPERQDAADDCYTAVELFQAIRDEDAVVIAHVGGRYADIKMAHDGKLERTVEVHSTWGTFEWLLHDAFERGYRVGVVCHSDDHKGRPGATRPGASHFGAIGGLSCYMMPELTREALFTAIRRRHHYGTTGTRLSLAVTGVFATPVSRYHEDPALGDAEAQPVTEVMMGDIVQPGTEPMNLTAVVVGSAPIDRVDIFHGKELIRTVRPFEARDLGRRVRVMWHGAEYRGRGREVVWKGKATLSGNRFSRASAINFLNPEHKLETTQAGTGLRWTSVTTGNMAGFDLWLDDPNAGTLAVETNVVSGTFAIDQIGLADTVVDGGGLGRKICVFRLPEDNDRYRLTFEHEVARKGVSVADLPVYVRVTQEDGHQAWSSPIYLIA